MTFQQQWKLEQNYKKKKKSEVLREFRYSRRLLFNQLLWNKSI